MLKYCDSENLAKAVMGSSSPPNRVCSDAYVQLQAATIRATTPKHKIMEHLQPRPATFNVPTKARSPRMFLQVTSILTAVLGRKLSNAERERG